MRNNILITGASSGLGAGMAREFAAMGRNLALCARRLDQLQELRAELLSINPEIQVVIEQLDVMDDAAVFRVFRAFDEQLGGVDRIIVNAGIGKGAKIGTGGYKANKQTAMVNFVAALVQCEAAMELFRKRNAGHLVTISSVSAMRGLPSTITAYAASKAGLAYLTEGIRMELLDSPIKISTIYPGYIATAINEGIEKAPFRVDLETGSKALVKAIESEADEVSVPPWPWKPIGMLMRNLPLRMVKKIT